MARLTRRRGVPSLSMPRAWLCSNRCSCAPARAWRCLAGPCAGAHLARMQAESRMHGLARSQPSARQAQPEQSQLRQPPLRQGDSSAFWIGCVITKTTSVQRHRFHLLSYDRHTHPTRDFQWSAQSLSGICGAGRAWDGGHPVDLRGRVRDQTSSSPLRSRTGPGSWCSQALILLG